ncbi:Flap endonuclease GEN-like protein [Lamellibrachia satsuma]|nr:Flap endonuclease GEN-like protein [Lamellibrachia satsuma]
MGVNDLWSVLEPAGSECSLTDLHGKTLAVDASVWVYQGQVDGRNLHLRSMFWRVHHMMQSQVRPVFVTEGPPHPLKLEMRALSSHQSVDGHTSSFARHTTQAGDTASLCCQLLKALGVPVIESAGEGEATCAALNQLKLVDGVITEDSDALLFGATVVYRYFSCDKKRGSMKRYTMEDIKKQLILDRRTLVAYALLAGCDFTRGVHGVGKAAAMKLLKSLSERDILERFQTWRNNHQLQMLETYRNLKKSVHCRICAHEGSRKLHKSEGCEQCDLPNSCTKPNSKICSCDWHKKTSAFEDRRCELDIRAKAMETTNFPDQRVIDAFLEPAELRKFSDEDKLQWHRPNIAAIKEVLYWSSARTKKHVLPMVTAYDMADILKNGDAAKDRIQPDCVLKMVTENGAKKLVVKWHFIADFSDDLVTTEDRELFAKCFPSCLQTFLTEEQRKSKSKVSRGSIKRKRKMEEVGQQEQGGLKQSLMQDFFKQKKV